MENEILVALNFLLCIVVFGFTLWAISALTEVIAQYRTTH